MSENNGVYSIINQYSAYDLANILIPLAVGLEHPLDPASLQKVIFFVDEETKKQNKRIINEDVEYSEALGPLYNSVFRAYCVYPAEKIYEFRYQTNIFTGNLIEPKKIDDETVSFIREYATQYILMDKFELNRLAQSEAIKYKKKDKKTKK